MLVAKKALIAVTEQPAVSILVLLIRKLVSDVELTRLAKVFPAVLACV